MKNRLFINIGLLGFLIIFLGMKPRFQEVQQFEGISYLDNLPIRVKVKNGKISEIIRIKSLSDEEKNVYIGPGLIDNQVNGYKGVSFSLGDANFNKTDVIRVTKGLWKVGVTTYLPTLRTNSQKNLIKNLKILANAKNDPATLGSIAGFHLEGPYISPLDGFRGAHALEYVRKPNWQEFMELYESSGENILEMTVAPEVEGAMKFINQCTKKNIIVGLGHHNATSEEVTEAVNMGARIATHLGNAMPNKIDRHKNPLWPQLSDDRLMVSIIGDGFHLSPEEIRVFYKAKGSLRTIITSDVTRYAGMPPGKYQNSEGDTILLTTDGAVMYLARNSLSGSASPVTKGVANVMKVTGCSMAEAFQMGATNAAKLYGLKDRGELRVGMRADLIIFSIDNFKINIKQTIVNGQLVYSAKG